MAQPLDFQSIILTLDHFWAEHGCLIWHPYYQQVGAGTMNPATFLRVLGPEPWNVGYLEPSIRPDDGRYGDNPNRLQQFYQYQVILKPDPGNPQELYLDSLKALGIDPHEHDIRFVEDNWQSPALGAWGLGWEVWCDGQEITQYTYFQQAGGFALDPVSVELTYGLERIAMTVQKVRSFRDIQWSAERTDGDVNLQGEKEHSIYYYDVADVARVQQMYGLYEAEANLALEKGLVLPAHDYILKLSHAFNILDARGAVGVTERQAMFGKMRDLSHRVAEAYLAQREAMGYPWKKRVESREQQADKAALRNRPTRPSGSRPTSFLFEIGTEELPVGDLDNALEQLHSRMPGWLDELRLTHGDVKVMGTPRRLVVMVDEVSPRQSDIVEKRKGPPVKFAFDSTGNPTSGTIGFANASGTAVANLKQEEINGGNYLIAEINQIGRDANDILAESLPGLIASLSFDKSMRWNESQVVFSRPIRWLLALLGEEVVPFEYAGLPSSNTTRGLRSVDLETHIVNSVIDYQKVLIAQGIVLDHNKRVELINEYVQSKTRSLTGDVVLKQELSNEVANLVEAPSVFIGNFPDEYLKLPDEVLIAVMQHHQRYFPVTKGGHLLPNFIGICNGDHKHVEIVRDGNEQVINARFADAKFFLEHDLQHKLEDFLPKLDTLTFQKKLGSMLAKSKRIEKVVDDLLKIVELPDKQKEETRRAAHLCKADLATRMVVEMTSLQGIMGEYFATKSGEAAGVAHALREHYLPRFAGDNLPTIDVGRVVGIADRLDSLAGLFAAGMAPTAAKDPFALRRAALGLVQILIGWKRDFDIEAALDLAIKELPIPMKAEDRAACMEFIRGRLQSHLLEQGNKYDVAMAVLSEQSRNPYGAARAVKELTAWTEKADWKMILPAYARCVRITRDQMQEYKVDLTLLKEPAEKELFKSVEKVESQKRKPGSVDDLLKSFVPLIPEINAFFEKVLVMDKDIALQHNRLGLLQRISKLAEGVADLSLLEGF